MREKEKRKSFNFTKTHWEHYASSDTSKAARRDIFSETTVWVKGITYSYIYYWSKV